MRKQFLTALLLLFASAAFAQSVVHTVMRGETLTTIAKKYGVTVADIEKANPSVGKMLYVGVKLNIPSPAQESDSQPSTGLYPVAEQPTEPMDVEPTPQPEYNYGQVSERVEKEIRSKGTFDVATEMVVDYYPKKENISTFAIGVALGAKYYLLDKLYLTGMVGWYMTTSSGNWSQYYTMSNVRIQDYYSLSGSTHSFYIPTEIGYTLPVGRTTCLDFAVSPYAMIGFYGSSTLKDRHYETDQRSYKTTITDLPAVKASGSESFVGIRFRVGVARDNRMGFGVMLNYGAKGSGVDDSRMVFGIYSGYGF